MSTQPVGAASDGGASVALQRWLDVITQASVSRTSAATDPAGTVEELTRRSDLLTDELSAHRLEDVALGAHAAVGELSVQRKTYAAVERAIAAIGNELPPRLAAVDDAYDRAAALAADRAAADRADAARDAAARRAEARTVDARRRAAAQDEARAAQDAAAAGDIHEAVRGAVAAFRETDRRLVELRDSARDAVHETAQRVGALAAEVASDNRTRALERQRARAADARESAEAHAALERRDAAVRELGRLLGATARENGDGTVDVAIRDRMLVEGARAARVAVAERAGQAPALSVDGTTLADPSGALAAFTGPGERGVTAARERLAEVARAFAAEVQRRQDAGRVPAAAGGDAQAPDVASTGQGPVPPAADATRRMAAAASSRGVASAELHGSSEVADTAGRSAPGARTLLRVGADGVLTLVGGADDVALPRAASSEADASGPEASTTTGAAAPVSADAAAAAGTPERAGVAATAGSEDPRGAVTATRPGVEVPPVAAPDAGEADLASAVSVAAAQGRFAATAASVIGDLLAEATERRQSAERRLDVLSVVDSVLAGAPTSQVGGLVRAALGAVTAHEAGSGRTSQELVSALQVVDGQAAAVKGSAEALLALPSMPALVVTEGDASLVSASPLAVPANVARASADGSGPAFLGRFGELLGAVGSVFRADAQLPVPPFDAQVDVASVARTGTTVSQAAFPTGHVLAGGARFILSLTEGTGESATTHRFAVGPGATMQTVVEAVNSLATHVRASTMRAGESSERLLLSGVGTGARTFSDLTDGRVLSAPSAVLGAFRPLERAADTVLEVRHRDGTVRTVTSPTATVTGALPGVALTLAPGAAGQSFTMTALPGAQALSDRVESVVQASSSLLATIGGAGPVPAGAAAVLATDPVVGDLASRVAAALSGAAAVPVGASAAAPVGMGPGSPSAPDGDPAVATAPLPVAGVRPGGTSGQGATYDREAFLRSYAQDPASTEEGAHRMAREVARITGEATDPRTGFLAVRILGEQAFAQEYSIGQADADQRMHDRHDVFERRFQAMQTLLGRLDDQRAWLQAALA